MKRRSLLSAALVAALFVPVMAAPAAAARDVYVDPAPPAECAAILAAHPEFAGTPCVITTTVGPVTKTTTTGGVTSRSATWHDGWWWFDTWISSKGPYGLWGFTTRFGGHYNGNAIWSDYVSCDHYSSVYSLKQTWCGVANNGGQNGRPADWGGNWTTCAYGFCDTHGHREAIDKNGTIVRIARW